MMLENTFKKNHFDLQVKIELGSPKIEIKLLHLMLYLNNEFYIKRSEDFANMSNCFITINFNIFFRARH